MSTAGGDPLRPASIPSKLSESGAVTTAETGYLPVTSRGVRSGGPVQEHVGAVGHADGRAAGVAEVVVEVPVEVREHLLPPLLGRGDDIAAGAAEVCLLYTSPSPRD